MTSEQLKDHFSILEKGSEKVLSDKFITSDKRLEVSNSVNIEFVFDSKDRSMFELFAVDVIGMSYQDKINGVVTLGKVQTVGNTQNNVITLALSKEITIRDALGGTTISNGIDRQIKSLFAYSIVRACRN